MPEEFDGETPDQKRAAEKRKAAAEADSGGAAEREEVATNETPKGRRSRKADDA